MTTLLSAPRSARAKGMELRHLRYFIVVSEELNLSKAAEKLRTSQPSLGQQIRDLELEVGVALFDREKNHFELTAAGNFLAEQAHAVAILGVDAADGACNQPWGGRHHRYWLVTFR